MDPLASIPGPLFLLLYLALVAVAALIARHWTMPAGSPSLPDVDGLPPAELALLREGTAGAVAVTAFRLVERGLATMDGSAGGLLVPVAGAQGGDDWERALLRLLPPAGCDARALYANASNDPAIAALAEDGRRRLRGLGLLRDAGQSQAAWTRTLLVVAAVTGVGAAKIALGLSRGRPVAFLVILAVIAVPAIILAARPWFARTAAGERFLARAAAHFRALMPRAQPAAPATPGMPAAGPDPAFAVAACGMVALTMLPGWSPFQTAFDPQRQAEAGGDGGYSADSGSSGDSGGDSGGSDAGGGCGGCGGGGD